ncbi:unnamed protein product [Acanthoscelides obtectus]|uniref:Gcp-like domain-containing protein n=1 Tax=Acanthoscelides obtectus TaxID=200917 RepID=A0A9P0LTZ0_ACAOB|nr:unnamed protein product [Acanthoscelides obtectus]CAK1681964.1 Probable tRNA N6-adenosine threonylcarbamoyltransferase, mitochondrial [Acanthoscelides obtectus]
MLLQQVSFRSVSLNNLLKNLNLGSVSAARWNSSKKDIILGIETSCDDTGCALIDTDGNLLGEALNSQHLIHLNNGGIIPPIAQDLHRKNIERVVEEAVDAANVQFEDISAIATTVKPGRDGGLKCNKFHLIHGAPEIKRQSDTGGRLASDHIKDELDSVYGNSAPSFTTWP